MTIVVNIFYAIRREKSEYAQVLYLLTIPLS